MPKIIDEARERILTEARKTLLTAGYKGLSLRGLARDCSVAVGTIYNYFPNKDTLIALVMMQDWTETIERMERGVAEAAGVSEGALVLYREIDCFSEIYRDVWHQFSQTAGAAETVGGRHRMLRRQIEVQWEALLRRFGYEKEIRLAPLLAETILAAARQEDIGPEAIRQMMQRMFPPENKK